MTRKILVSSALPYANGAIHMGHLVEYIYSDIWARFQKMRGHRCTYVCAADAHGTPIMIKARQENVDPEEMVKRISAETQTSVVELTRRIQGSPKPEQMERYLNPHATDSAGMVSG